MNVQYSKAEYEMSDREPPEGEERCKEGLINVVFSSLAFSFDIPNRSVTSVGS